MRAKLTIAALLMVPLLAAGRREADWVSLRRGPCFGNCPIYEVTLRDDGSATYLGGDYAPRRGRHEGRVDPRQVAQLVERLHEVGFWEMRVDRQLRVMDMPAATLRAERRGRRQQVHTNLPPRELAPIQAAIDSIADEIDWHPAQESRPRPVAFRPES